MQLHNPFGMEITFGGHLGHHLVSWELPKSVNLAFASLIMSLGHIACKNCYKMAKTENTEHIKIIKQ